MNHNFFVYVDSLHFSGDCGESNNVSALGITFYFILHLRLSNYSFNHCFLHYLLDVHVPIISYLANRFLSNSWSL